MRAAYGDVSIFVCHKIEIVMKRLLLCLLVAGLASCSEKKSSENTLTVEEENQLVESVSEELQERVKEIDRETDSLSQSVDSLLNTF